MKVEKLVAYRGNRTQAEMAKKYGVTQQSWQAWENGDAIPRHSVMLQIERDSGYKMEDIFLKPLTIYNCNKFQMCEAHPQSTKGGDGKMATAKRKNTKEIRWKFRHFLADGTELKPGEKLPITKASLEAFAQAREIILRAIKKAAAA